MRERTAKTTTIFDFGMKNNAWAKVHTHQGFGKSCAKFQAAQSKRASWRLCALLMAIVRHFEINVSWSGHCNLRRSGLGPVNTASTNS
jgi:hypothetical protein